MKGEIEASMAERRQDFWGGCVRLLAVYPERPFGMSGDAEAKQLERRLRLLANEFLPLLCDNEHRFAEASVRKCDSWPFRR